MNEKEPPPPRPRVDLPIVVAFGYAIVAAGLITLRALVVELEFLSAGWIFLFALVPVLPWLIQLLAPLVGRIAPFVQSVKFAGIEIPLGRLRVAGLHRDTRRPRRALRRHLRGR